MNNNSGDIRRKFRLRQRNCEGEINDTCILGQEVYNLTQTGLICHFKFSKVERTWKCLPHNLLMHCLSCLPSACPQNTAQTILCLLSDWQHLLLVPFLPSSEGKSLREVMRRQSPELGLAQCVSCSTGAEQPAWASC